LRRAAATVPLCCVRLRKRRYLPQPPRWCPLWKRRLENWWLMVTGWEPGWL